MKPVIVVDLGGTNLRIARVVGNNVEHREIFSTPRGAESIVGLIAEQAMKLSAGTAVGVAVAAPGAVSRGLGGLSKAPNLPELDGYPMAEEIRRLSGLHCMVENDANAYAVGEVTYGAAIGYKSVVVITLGTGIGGGIVLEGRLWRGADGVAAEIGHVCIEENGRRCGCGASGCAEAYGSASSMLRLAKEYGSNATSAREAYELAKNGEQAALKAFKRAGTALGILISSLVNILNPQAVVIGGGGSAAYDLLEPYILEEMKLRTFPLAMRNLQLLRCKLKNYAALLGAAVLLEEQIST
ncbi:MAG: ROK family protein [Acidobacteriota bacterium]|nr:ROK family protein [Blastocatellia bacterium]MDW8412684.1 ROK family protein [Acidobacteriota bacterium]